MGKKNSDQVFFFLKDGRPSFYGGRNNLGQEAKEEDDANVEARTENTTPTKGTEGTSLSARTDKEQREKPIGLTDEGKFFYSNDVVDGWYGEIAKYDQFFQPQISVFMKKCIIDNQVRDTEFSLLLLKK